MTTSFQAKVHVPLDAGFVSLEIDLPDINQLDDEEQAVVFGSLAKTIEFAKAKAISNGGNEPLALPSPKPAAPPTPKKAATNGKVTVGKVSCLSCDYSGTPHGLAIHTSKQHPESRARCAVEGCDTILSSYNKADRCSLHESKR